MPIFFSYRSNVYNLEARKSLVTDWLAQTLNPNISTPINTQPRRPLLVYLTSMLGITLASLMLRSCYGLYFMRGRISRQLAVWNCVHKARWYRWTPYYE